MNDINDIPENLRKYFDEDTSESFIKPYDDDPEFFYVPYRAWIFLERRECYGDYPFTDYMIKYYKKYDPESYEIAIEWNKKFTQKQIDYENQWDLYYRRKTKKYPRD